MDEIDKKKNNKNKSKLFNKYKLTIKIPNETNLQNNNIPLAPKASDKDLLKNNKKIE